MSESAEWTLVDVAGNPARVGIDTRDRRRCRASRARRPRGGWGRTGAATAGGRAGVRAVLGEHVALVGREPLAQVVQHAHAPRGEQARDAQVALDPEELRDRVAPDLAVGYPVGVACPVLVDEPGKTRTRTRRGRRRRRRGHGCVHDRRRLRVS
jgi:hypothetical protein